MQTLKLEIQDNMLDKIMWLLGSFNDIKVENITNTTNMDIEDIRLFEKAKQDKSDIKSIEDMLKEYNIEN